MISSLSGRDEILKFDGKETDALLFLLKTAQSLRVFPKKFF